MEPSWSLMWTTSAVGAPASYSLVTFSSRSLVEMSKGTHSRPGYFSMKASATLVQREEMEYRVTVAPSSRAF